MALHMAKILVSWMECVAGWRRPDDRPTGLGLQRHDSQFLAHAGQ